MKRTYQTRNNVEDDITRSLCWLSKERNRNAKRQSSWSCHQKSPQFKFAQDPPSSTNSIKVLPNQDNSNELYLLNPAVPWKKNIWLQWDLKGNNRVLKGFVKSCCCQGCLHFAEASDSLGDKLNTQSWASFWRWSEASAYCLPVRWSAKIWEKMYCMNLSTLHSGLIAISVLQPIGISKLVEKEWAVSTVQGLAVP